MYMCVCVCIHAYTRGCGRPPSRGCAAAQCTELPSVSALQSLGRPLRLAAAQVRHRSVAARMSACPYPTLARSHLGPFHGAAGGPYEYASMSWLMTASPFIGDTHLSTPT